MYPEPVLIAWAVVGFLIWSAIGITLTFITVLIPALFGCWRAVQWIACLLVLIEASLWIMALNGIYTGLPLPTRPRAGIVVFPIMALWPGFLAFAVHSYRRSLRATGEI